MNLTLEGKYMSNDWEEIDTVETEDEKEQIEYEYSMAFGEGWKFRWV